MDVWRPPTSLGNNFLLSALLGSKGGCTWLLIKV